MHRSHPISTRLLIAMATLGLSVACHETPTASEAEASFSATGRDIIQFTLLPPAGALHPEASAKARLEGSTNPDHPNFDPLEGFDVEVKDLPCRGLFKVAGAIEQTSREFYALYVSTASSGRVRIFSFNTSCVSDNQHLDWFIPSDLPVFTEEVTMEVFLETDDGADGPDIPGTLVLTGTGSAN